LQPENLKIQKEQKNMIDGLNFDSVYLICLVVFYHRIYIQWPGYAVQKFQILILVNKNIVLVRTGLEFYIYTN